MKTQYEKNIDQLFKAMMITAGATFALMLGAEAFAAEPQPSEAEQREQVRKLYGAPACADTDLFSILYSGLGGKVEGDCVYMLEGALVVKQVVTPGAVLVGPANLKLSDKWVLIRTSHRELVDGDTLPEMAVKLAGQVTYPTAAGSKRTVNAFDALRGD